MITQEELLKLVSYVDGTLIRIKPSGYSKIGDVVGTMRNDGYLMGGIQGKKYLLHRLIFLYHHGYMPKYIDHINCIKHDNRIENLREASYRNNNSNSSIRSDNSSGIKGVFYKHSKACWVAKVTAKGKVYRKTFSGSSEDTTLQLKAMEWVCIKRVELHGEFANHG